MNLFGTDGIRKEFGKAPLTNKDLIDLSKAIAKWAINQDKNNKIKIILANDTRYSADFIKSQIISGLIESNIEIFDANVLPTSALYFLVQKEKLFDFGIMITASHNLFQDNGIKIISQRKQKLDENDEQLISDFFLKKNFEPINYCHVGDLNYLDVSHLYINNFYNFFESNFAQDLKIVIDCAHGATYKIASTIFQNFGAKVIAINAEPNGKNINYHCGSTSPQKLSDRVLENNADVGFAFDGDGDRVIAVNSQGQIKDGDDILAFLINNPHYNSQTIIGTVVANFGLESYLNSKDKRLIRTSVGDKNVTKELIKNDLIIGGEPSGHIILRDFLNTSDGIFTALRVLETMKLTNNNLMQTFEKFPQHTINLKIDIKKDLNQEPFSNIISQYQKKINGRLIIRYSGTESVLRIVAESQNLNEAKQIALDLSNELNNAFNIQIKDLSNGKKKELNP